MPWTITIGLPEPFSITCIILSIFSTRILNNNDIEVYEDGFQTRDFIFIDDVVDISFAALISNSLKHKVYNVGSGLPQTVISVAEKLKETLKSNININVSKRYRLGDIRNNFADLKRLINQHWALCDIEGKVSLKTQYTNNTEGTARDVSCTNFGTIAGETVKHFTNYIIFIISGIFFYLILYLSQLCILLRNQVRCLFAYCLVAVTICSRILSIEISLFR